ncbi:methyltransferase domain-containing protein [Paenarthrobacter sp. PH39-S1]|uniref:class I SAM-dependent methyltransferase n=1 Tax=Paenarthrobacter sp. PH39-S1 TaxID=3046204 RepID=UPI0024B96AFF|nr:methyltransferase domain-containing protein [Paenarthrobacter sp. PH39-S1]MDJ0358272.1 methyltransferase domain-containing protein [Paenarthrobacter sp. PH39-S1]
MGDKYTRFAPFYDLLSGEYPLYHAGRVLGTAALAPTQGQQVLDIGCGTGLNFALLQDRIGASGTIVGIDRSAQMLRQARRRAEARHWDNVILVQADMVLEDPATLQRRIVEAGGTALSDAALATYSLSLMGDWERAWATTTSLLGPGGLVGVVDMQDPLGWARWLTPLARLACALGGSDIHAAPWRAVEEQCTEVVRASARAGHLQIRAGKTVPSRTG